MIKNPSAEAEAWVQSLGWKDLLENPMGRGAWWATVYGVAKMICENDLNYNAL